MGTKFDVNVVLTLGVAIKVKAGVGLETEKLENSDRNAIVQSPG